MNDVVVNQSITAEQAWQLSNGLLRDPFSILGPFQTDLGRLVRGYFPGALSVEVVSRIDGRHLGTLSPTMPEGLFAGLAEGQDPYRFRIQWPGAMQEIEDSYSFDLLLSETDLHLF